MAAVAGPAVARALAGAGPAWSRRVAPPLSSYTFESLAAAVAGTVGTAASAVVLGHSLGGVVGLALASGGFPVPLQAVIGLGIKVTWAEDELDRCSSAGAPVTGLVRLA